MAELRRSREPAVWAGIEGLPTEALVVRGPRGAVSYEDQRWRGGVGFREVYSHEVATGEDAEHGVACPRLDGLPCSSDSASRDVVARWEREGAFETDDATFALLERQYDEWMSGS